MRGGCIRRLAVRFFIEILAGIYPGYQRFSSRCSAEDTSGEKKSGSCLSGQGRRHERRSWMFENKRVCNWLGAIEGFALWSKGFSRGSLWRLETGNRAWKASGTQGSRDSQPTREWSKTWAIFLEKPKINEIKGYFVQKFNLFSTPLTVPILIR